MEKQIYDEKNGLWYELHGDYYLPCLSVPPKEQRPMRGVISKVYSCTHFIAKASKCLHIFDISTQKKRKRTEHTKSC